MFVFLLFFSAKVVEAGDGGKPGDFIRALAKRFVDEITDAEKTYKEKGAELSKKGPPHFDRNRDRVEYFM